MVGGRKDGWTVEEDTLLAEIILRYIREGNTQLKAFEEVGRRLARTAAACGFRWNSFVRKQHKNEILSAKKERRGLVIPSAGRTVELNTGGHYDIDDCIQGLEQFKKEYALLEKKYKTLSEEHQSLLAVLEKARQLSVTG